MAVPKAQESIRQAQAYARMIMQTLITLASGALGFVAALAWNDAIKETITRIVGADESLTGRYLYAVLATAISIIVVLALTRIAAKIGGEAVITREVD
jgi:F0F1-type ATP synthase gamma subunit